MLCSTDGCISVPLAEWSVLGLFSLGTTSFRRSHIVHRGPKQSMDPFSSWHLEIMMTEVLRAGLQQRRVFQVELWTLITACSGGKLIAIRISSAPVACSRLSMISCNCTSQCSPFSGTGTVNSICANWAPYMPEFVRFNATTGTVCLATPAVRNPVPDEP